MTANELAQYYGDNRGVDEITLSEEDMEIRVGRVWKQVRRSGTDFTSGQLTEALLDGLDEVFVTAFGALQGSNVSATALVGTKNAAVAQYFAGYVPAVMNYMKGKVAGENWSHEEEKAVANAIMAKVRWVLHHHEGFVRLPLLTSSMIMGIAEGLAMSPRALREVSGGS
jgi:hypothetical protein